MFEEEPNHEKEPNIDVKSTLEDFEHRIEQKLEHKLETYMTHWGEKISQMLNPQNTSTPFDSKSKGIDGTGTQLLRKQKFLCTTISVICEEIHKLNQQENSSKEMENTLKRLHSLECDYSNIIQTLVASVIDEDSVDKEIQRRAAFQQRIFEVSSLAEKCISSHRDIESETRCQMLNLKMQWLVNNGGNSGW